MLIQSPGTAGFVSTNSVPVFGSVQTTGKSLVRVLHIINGEHFSGAERVQQLLGQRLESFGFEPLFACVKPGKFRSCANLRDYQVIDTPMRRRFDLQVVQQLVMTIRDCDIQLLHAHTPRTALVTSLAARRTGLPWVYHVHSPAARDSTRGFLNRLNTFVEQYAMRRCDLLMTVSKSLRREMLRQGVARARLAVVPNGVPKIEPIRPETRMGCKHWKLGMVALMRPRKGVEVALRAMQKLKRQGLSIELQLIGGFETGEYESQIIGLIDQLEIEDVVQKVGFTNDIPSVIRSLDGLLLPSLFGEGMPMVVLEAISAGVPVVATRVEGTPEVIRHGVEGYLAKPRDSSSFAEMVRLLTSDRKRWSEMSSNALERHRLHFSDLGMAERVANAYRKVLDHPRHRTKRYV